MGFFWALLSVGLVSAAQLLLRSAMVALPPLTDIVAFLQHLLHFQPGTFGRGDHRRRRIDHLLAGETPLAGEPAFGTARAEQDRQLAASDGGFHPDFTDAG